MAEPDTSIEAVASGQRLVIIAILVNLAGFAARFALPELWIAISLLGTVLSIVGVFRMGTGLGYSTGLKIVLIILLFLPLISLLVLVSLNARATKALKEHGYRVGLLGAKSQDVRRPLDG